MGRQGAVLFKVLMVNAQESAESSLEARVARVIYLGGGWRRQRGSKVLVQVHHATNIGWLHNSPMI